jgi:ABC-type transport system involved in cytochrome c biogenesis, permease component
MQNKTLKYIITGLFVAIIIAMATATFFDQYTAEEHIYSSLWFCGLWAALSVLSAFVFLKRLTGKVAALLFHLSFLLILAGALATKLTSKEGMLHLRCGEKTDYFILKKNTFKEDFGFEVRLDSFVVLNYQGTQMPQDYASHLTILDNGKQLQASVSMNNIFKRNGFRFYQTSFDEDRQGSVLSVSYDPIGIPLTYLGYLLFALSGIWMLFSRKSAFLQLLRHPLLQKGGLFVLLLCISHQALPQERKVPTISAEQAAQLSEKQIVYNGRIAPFNTMARDFLLKTYGKSTYHQLTPEQVVCGWIYRPEVWKDEKMILVKDKQLRKQLGLEKYASFADFFDEKENYRLNGLPLTKGVRETDEKVGVILMLTKGKLFSESSVTLPEAKVKAEIIYNKINFAKILFMLNLTLGFAAFLLMIFTKGDSRFSEKFFKALKAILVAVLLFDLCGYILRWYISGRIPMGNGYETMLFMSLIIMAMGIFLKGKFATSAGFLLSGFTLLVAYLGQKNPQITPLMPVLNSPILSAHVSTIMIAYSLLAFTFFNGIFSLFFKEEEKKTQLALLSRIMLYPAEILLGIGIFLGAVWANISWGTYWSWDPKETWALITFMVYAVPFHSTDLKFLRDNRNLHLYFIISFAAVLFTYFGVNYFLGGMHSYAN